MGFDKDLHLGGTELRLGPPGTTTPAAVEELEKRSNKRSLPDMDGEEDSGSRNNISNVSSNDIKRDQGTTPPTKAQVVGWPPVRSSRKNMFQSKKMDEAAEAMTGIYVKVSMDGAPYLRKIDLNVYKGYPELLQALEGMFNFKVGKYCEREGYVNGSEYVPTYEDKDGDWMLVGDVPWNMFMNSCKRLRIVKESEARGLGCACACAV